MCKCTSELHISRPDSSRISREPSILLQNKTKYSLVGTKGLIPSTDNIFLSDVESHNFSLLIVVVNDCQYNVNLHLIIT